MKNLLKIIYSINILTKYKEISKEKSNFFREKNETVLKLNNEDFFNELLTDIIKPIDNLYDFELVYDKNYHYIRLIINFSNIKNIINEGKILPCRNKLFEVLTNYKKNLNNKFYSDINNFITNDENEINKKFSYLKSDHDDKILNKKLFVYDDIIFNLDDKSIFLEKGKVLHRKYLKFNRDITKGGIIIDENEYGKYLESHELPLNKILIDNEKPSINNFLEVSNFINSKKNNKISNLVIVSISRINYWKNFLKDKNTLIINNTTVFKKLYYQNILNYDYVIVTLNLLNGAYYKNKFEEYDILQDKSFKNIRNDLMRNENILWEKEPLIHMFMWNNLIIDFSFDDLKKNMNEQFIKNISSFKRWVIFNNFKENKDLTQNIFSLFSNKLDCCSLKKFITNNKKFEPKLNIEMEKIYLKFNITENKGYCDYVDSLKEIYVKNKMRFEEDEYLQKYCSYPQRHIKINKILKNLQETDKFLKMNQKYKNLIQEKINHAHNHNGEITCKICLDNIDVNNLGITECGHLYCFSCIYKNIKYSDKCPTCREKISLDKIFFLTDKDQEIVLNVNILDELGTKNSKLLMLLNNFNKVMILSNFDECLDKLKRLFDEININSVKTREFKDYNCKKVVYLSNYNEDFYNYENILDVEQIICLEPYYSNKKRLKFYDIINKTNTNKFKFLLIKDTIEDEIKIF